MLVEHLRPIRYPDELDATTWLSDAGTVRVHREYLATQRRHRRNRGARKPTGFP